VVFKIKKKSFSLDKYIRLGQNFGVVCWKALVGQIIHVIWNSLSD
jgi:hypothetical protein